MRAQPSTPAPDLGMVGPHSAGGGRRGLRSPEPGALSVCRSSPSLSVQRQRRCRRTWGAGQGQLSPWGSSSSLKLHLPEHRSAGPDLAWILPQHHCVIPGSGQVLLVVGRGRLPVPLEWGRRPWQMRAWLGERSGAGRGSTGCPGRGPSPQLVVGRSQGWALGSHPSTASSTSRFTPLPSNTSAWSAPASNTAPNPNAASCPASCTWQRERGLGSGAALPAGAALRGEALTAMVLSPGHCTACRSPLLRSAQLSGRTLPRGMNGQSPQAAGSAPAPAPASHAASTPVDPHPKSCVCPTGDPGIWACPHSELAASLGPPAPVPCRCPGPSAFCVPDHHTEARCLALGGLCQLIRAPRGKQTAQMDADALHWCQGRDSSRTQP